MSEIAGEPSVLELSPEERAEQDVTPEEVRDALVEAIRTADRDEKVFEGCTFPALDLDYSVIEGSDNHPVVFRDCTFEEEISVEKGDVALPLVFEDCEIGSLDFYHARFEYDVEFHYSTITGEVLADETWFEQDAEFDHVTFEAEVEMVETTFGDDTSFVDATFEAPASFRGSEFQGVSNQLDDNVSFENAVFEAEVTFEQTEFEANEFDHVTFRDRADFTEAELDGDTEFNDVTFEGPADFRELECHEDADFQGVVFEKDADFQGVLFTGGARSLEDDTRFVDAVFHGEAFFREAEFRYSNFGDATFEGKADFEEAWFDADADFDGATFEDVADFDEARFAEDVDFSDVVFQSRAVFRGAEFRGDANQLEDNASFDGASFEDTATFAEAEFTSADFMRTTFASTIDFEGAVFSDRIDMNVLVGDGKPYVGFTDATIAGGTITQPRDGWVRYDLTRASIGDIDLQSAMESGERQLLDYFRFCETIFDEFDGNEFDFSSHTDYLDRNEWTLHDFDDSKDQEYAVEMTPETIEMTYLNAKSSASAAGNMKAAGEFRVKRQYWARQKHWAIAGDPQAGTRARVKNGVRALENGFLGLTCGHGMRIFRIFGVFAVAPFVFSLFYAFGGKIFATSVGQPASVTAALTTPEGQATFFKLISFAYITFLTIGYGNIGPVGWGARILASFEVYLNVILGGLVLYALIKRSEM